MAEIKMSLTDEDVKAIIERKKILLRSIGLTDDQMACALRDTEQEYQSYQEAFRLRDQGESYSEISGRLNYETTSIFKWINEGITPNLLKQDYLFSKQSVKKDNLDDLVALMAVAATKRHSRNNQLPLSSRDRTVLENLKLPIFNVLSVIPQIRLRRDQWMINLTSKPFFDFFNGETNYNQVIPWRFLDSLDRKKHYFSHFFSKRGGISLCSATRSPYGEIVFFMERSRDFRDDFAHLLLEIGFIPRVKNNRIYISDYVDLKKLVDERLCFSQRKLQILREVTGIIVPVAESEYRRKRKEKLLEIVPSKGNLGVFDYVRSLGSGDDFALLVADIYKLKDVDDLESLDDLNAYIADQTYPDQGRDELLLEADVMAWRKYVAGENCPSNDHTQLEDIFNMYVPDQFLQSQERVNACHLQLYRHLRQHPQFTQLVKLGDDYLGVRNVDFVGSIVSGAGVGRKQRSLEEAKEIMNLL